MNRMHLRRTAGLAALLACGLLFSACGGDDDGNKDATPGGDGGTNTGMDANPMGMDATGPGPDAGGRDATPGMDAPAAPCPQGSEGCPCDPAGMCGAGLECAEWPQVRMTDPIIRTCVRTCNNDQECAMSTVGNLCRAFFIDTIGMGGGITGICAEAENPAGETCKGSKRGMRTMTGCEENLTCLTNQVGGDDGVCAQLCVVSTSTPTGGCMAPTPYCNPAGSGLVINSTITMMAEPVGACAVEAIPIGARCGQDDITRACDTSSTSGDLGCIGLTDLLPDGEGYCFEFCRLADNICRSSNPGSGAYTCTPAIPNNTTFGVCSANCVLFPDTCAGPGHGGNGSTCIEGLAFAQGAPAVSLCYDNLAPALREQIFDVVGGQTQPRAGSGENCAGTMGENFRCPDGTFCATQGAMGVCIRGCTTSTTGNTYVRGGCELNSNTSTSAICFPDPRQMGDDQLCAEP
jgi:hypothetical protein